MKRIILATAAWTGLAAGAALADVQPPLAGLETCPVVQSAVGQLQTEGYTGIVVHLATHQARVEATLAGQLRTFRYECGGEADVRTSMTFRDNDDDGFTFVDNTGAGDDGGNNGNGPDRPHGGGSITPGNGSTGGDVNTGGETTGGEGSGTEENGTGGTGNEGNGGNGGNGNGGDNGDGSNGVGVGNGGGNGTGNEGNDKKND